MPSLWGVLSVAIGITFIFMILSLFNTWVQEFIATLLSMRAKNLANILQNMLDPAAQKLDGYGKLAETWSAGPLQDTASKLSQNALKAFYEHPIIYSLSEPGKEPSYVSAHNFAVALFDLLNKAGAGDPSHVDISLENIRTGIQKLETEPLKLRLLSLLDTAQITENKVELDIADYRKAVEAWFDASMERGRGWYKRKIQWVGIICGVAIAVLVNADTVSLSLSLWQNSVLRDAVTQAATIYVEKGDEPNARQAQQQLVNLGLPVGWSFRFADDNLITPDDPRDFPVTIAGWFAKLTGLLATGFAISQGSPIWFELLNRLVDLRGSGSRPETQAEDRSKAKD